MSREQHISEAIAEQLKTISGIRVYEQVMMNKFETYQFDYVGLYGSTDERMVESLEDLSSVANMGKIDIYLLCGNSVKKSPTLGVAKLRNAMQELCEKVEYHLQNMQPERYNSDFEQTDFSPVNYIASEPVTFTDDETKGLTIMTFRVFYTRFQR